MCLVAIALCFTVDDVRADLGTHITVPAGRGADGVAIGDVLAGGGQELLVANRVSRDIMIYQWDSAAPGTLRIGQVIKTNWAPAVIATADVNRDSLTDLVIAHYDDYQGAGKSDSFGVCYRDPVSGQLGAEVVYHLPRGLSSRAIAVGDVNSDGFAEIVVANELVGTEVFVWGWSESSSLKLIASLGGIHGYVVSLSIGDVTGDDRNDIVLYGTRMFVVSQKPDRTLSSAADHGPTGGESCAIGDVNRDGLNDVVGATAFSGEIEIWHQTPIHTLTRQEKRACGSYTEDVVVADLNHDGLADVAVASRDESSLFVFFQRPVGGFGEPSVMATVDARWLNELAVGDLNGDGLADLVASHWGSPRAVDPEPGFVSVWYSRTAAPVAGDP